MLCVFYAEPRISRVAISSGRAGYITQPSPRLKGQICMYFANKTKILCSLRGIGGARRKSCAVIPGLGLVSISPQMSPPPPQKGGRAMAALSPSAVSPTGAVRRKSFALVENKVRSFEFGIHIVSKLQKVQSLKCLIQNRKLVSNNKVGSLAGPSAWMVDSPPPRSARRRHSHFPIPEHPGPSPGNPQQVTQKDNMYRVQIKGGP